MGALMTFYKVINYHTGKYLWQTGWRQYPELKNCLVLMPEEVHFSVPVRMATVRTNKLQGLSKALGANLEGELP